MLGLLLNLNKSDEQFGKLNVFGDKIKTRIIDEIQNLKGVEIVIKYVDQKFK